MRNLLDLVSSKPNLLLEFEQLDEIEQTFYSDDSAEQDLLQKYNGKNFHSKQYDLFKDIPSLVPELPKNMVAVGKIGQYIIVKDPQKPIDGYTSTQYILFDKDHIIGGVHLRDVKAPTGDGINNHFPAVLTNDLNGFRVSVVYIKNSYRGQNLALKLYLWLLQNVADYLCPDTMQTRSGMILWRKMLNRSKTFDVYVYDPKQHSFRRRWAGKDFDQVYNNRQDLIPFVTLPGKINDMID